MPNKNAKYQVRRENRLSMTKRKLPKGIRENNGTYEARASINGEKIRVYGRDLEKLIGDFELAKEQARRNTELRSGEITLNEWFDKWFTSVKSKKIKETSVAPMRNNYNRTFGFYLGTKKVNEIIPLDVQEALNAMEQNGIPKRAMRDALGRLKECMEFALGNQMIKSNPCVIVEVPWEYKKSKEEVALTQSEQDAFLEEMESSWYKELFFFMCLTGTRVGEVGGLKWEDIDFKNKVIHIRRALSCNYCNGVKREMLVSPKTVNSTRTIPFIGEMEAILLSQKEKQGALRKELGDRWRSKGELDGIVFTTGMGSPCSRYIVEKEIKKAIKRMREVEAVCAVRENRQPKEIRDFHPHSLRHTFATRCFEKKMEPKVVQSLLGHASISITLNIYTHVLENKMTEEISKFGYAKTENIPVENIKMPTITALSHC